MANKLFVPLLLTLLILSPLPSWAASGGRMGGRSTSSSSPSTSSSSSSSSRSHSSSSTHNYFYRSYYSPPATVEKANAEEEKATDFMFLIAILVMFVLVVGAVGLLCYFAIVEEERRVFKLQVGLLGKTKSLQNELNRIAETADTSNRKGYSYILTETTVALLRHSDNFIATCATEDVKKSTREWEKWLSESSINQRRKFDEETLINVDDTRAKRPTTRNKKNGSVYEYMVVTILVVAQGKHELSSIKNTEDLEKVLTSLGSIPSADVEAVEVLWTPQADDDVLSEQEYRKDYPLLASIYSLYE